MHRETVGVETRRSEVPVIMVERQEGGVDVGGGGDRRGYVARVLLVVETDRRVVVVR